MDFPIYRLLGRNDLPEIIKLMEEIRPPVAGLRSRQIYAAICCAALKTDKVVFVVAEQETKLIGFAIAIIEYKRFWKIFLRNHILLALQIIVSKFVQFFQRKRKANASFESNTIRKYLYSRHPGHPERSWKDSSPFIAKSLYTGVRRNFRKRGIGKDLQKFRNHILAQRSVKRVDAKIDPQNIPSIRMHHATGTQIVQERSRMLFVTTDLQ